MKNKTTNTHQVPFYQYIISLLCVAFLTGGGFYIYFDHQYKVQLASNSFSDKSLNKVNDLYNEIVSNYAGEIDKQKLIDGALQGMTDALGDPYSTYLNDSDADKLDQTISGSFEGIGASIAMKNKVPTIAEAPISGSPAEKAGLKVNDVIVKINDKEIKDRSLTEIVSEIRGKKGSTVQLTILRGTDTMEFTITRDEVPIETVKGSVDENNSQIGHISVSTFSANTAKEFKEAIEKLRKAGVTAFVIDLRQNPGGLLGQVEQMASMFLKNGKTIVKFEDKNGQKAEIVASKELDEGFKVKEPTVVLVDNGSASASEIFAAALKESANNQIIGTTTYGKGKVQTVKKLNDNSEVKLTILKWLTPKDNWVQDKGLEPTIQVDYADYAYLSAISRETVLKEGDQSAAVKNLNALLNALGYDVEKESSDFSEVTKEAIESIQEKANINITGEVDNETATIIERELTKKIKENDTPYSTAVTELKKQLEKKK